MTATDEKTANLTTNYDPAGQRTRFQLIFRGRVIAESSIPDHDMVFTKKDDLPALYRDAVESLREDYEARYGSEAAGHTVLDLGEPGRQRLLGRKTES